MPNRPGSEHLATLGGAFFKKEADLKPHRVRYWLTPKPDPAFASKCADICAVYKAAAAATPDDAHRTISIDEMTGIQALERIAPGLPMMPGKVERREFEYRRHGTQTLIAAFDVATDKVEGVIGKTRTEKDFARFLRSLLRSAASDVRWDIVCDNLNIHLSEAVVRSWLATAGSRTSSASRVSPARFQGHQRRLPVSAPASRHLPLHAQTRLVAQPDRNLVLHPGAKAHPPGQFRQQESAAHQNRRVHRILPFRWTMEAKPLTG
jgi:hypothetical protein